MWLLEDRRSIVYHGRVRLDNAVVTTGATDLINVNGRSHVEIK